MIKYINDKTHILRYVFKNRKNGEVYFVVNITLLFGEDLQEALREEDERSREASIAISRTVSIKDTSAGASELDSPVQEFHDAKTF